MALDPDYDYTQDELDNHSDQLNPNNDAYESSRDHDWSINNSKRENQS